MKLKLYLSGQSLDVRRRLRQIVLDNPGKTVKEYVTERRATQ